MEDCIFCKIVAGEIRTNFIEKQADIVAFYDIVPLAPTHILILPKEHINTFLDIKDTHFGLISKMITLAQNLIKNYNFGQGYKMVFNGGHYQHVAHLHWHLLADSTLQPLASKRLQKPSKI